MTLDHLAQMVKEGTEFEVRDARTGEEITRSVLTQIIFEEEAKGQNLLPIQFLRRLIRFYGDSLQAFVPGYLDMTMESFTKNQGAMKRPHRRSLRRRQPDAGNHHPAEPRHLRTRDEDVHAVRHSGCGGRGENRRNAARQGAEAEAKPKHPKTSPNSKARWKRCGGSLRNWRESGSKPPFRLQYSPRQNRLDLHDPVLSLSRYGAAVRG